ncbi:hypothetical protein [Nocardioides sp. Soil805]|uniref:hypothetical protein n=1 Tax=Nocardioides sp. Soil805 TaxID=1736416 RepID=UPI0007029754|nr:hypothetical protein [Nocardioides sp. Soil805]KRF34976.1 hypothetical protein ASG94_12610 [Nocardioides sp. Soil805]
MPANPWQLRCDTAPLAVASAAWLELADVMTSAADDLVRASRRVRDHGWESGSADVYDGHRRQVVGGLDTVAEAAREISRVLADVAGTLSSSQRRLDREWSVVAAVPHATLGTEGVLVFHEDSDDQRGQVQRATRTAQAIRSELDASIEGLSGRLRAAHVELQRAADAAIAGSTGSSARGGIAAIAELVRAMTAQDVRQGTGDGSVTNVSGGLDYGTAYAPGLVPTSFTAPTLSGLSTGTSGVDGMLAGGLAAGLGLRRRRDGRVEPAHPAMSPGMTTGRGGQGAARGGTRGGTPTRAGAVRPGAAGSRSTTPTETDAERDARLLREKSEAKAAKKLVVQERQAARAARRAEQRRTRDTGGEGPEDATD